MAKIQTKYVCQSCGYSSPRWVGKCPNCSEWNTFVEEAPAPIRAVRKTGVPSTLEPVSLDTVEQEDVPRIRTTIQELDRVLGGGIVPGSLLLLGGDPGIGKSTLMMQAALALKDTVVLYVTGEESVRQIKLRAERLERTSTKHVLLLAETNLDLILDVIERGSPDVLVIDSIQTMFRPGLESAPGSVSQVRESTALLLRLAKTKGIPIFIIGHVTKEGMIAGPKVIEHMVDCVLQFEGEVHYSYRILRALKNRFGSTNEIGIFEMHDTGLREVQNASEVFLSERHAGFSGSTVVASMEGTRPILLEVQALVSTSNYGMPQRNSTGVDFRRLALLLAVLEKRVGLNLGQQDVFVNVAGGIRIEEPAVDLGIASSIVSSLRDVSVDASSVAVGEIGLGGEIRTVGHIDKRVQEAAKLGFKRFVLPKSNVRNLKQNGDIELIPVERIEQAIEALLGESK
ncbi:MAG: DNA repair protein RadA [Ignavibacteria bacterium GWA2_55_11]|nr:MAG: DNA repair protein RadA [Ignavibacteria bacterium GWA2_55_11]OGU72421.1 MAG: DNA repair protein RadA [Ignavibacteria bacterium RIFCSPLOWO2_12_FULL_56_21]